MIISIDMNDIESLVVLEALREYEINCHRYDAFVCKVVSSRIKEARDKEYYKRQLVEDYTSHCQNCNSWLKELINFAKEQIEKEGGENDES